MSGVDGSAPGGTRASPVRPAPKVVAAGVVFATGFAIMVLEIIGARYLSKDFGGSFYVWVSQIGVVLTALALGYTAGGALGDRFHRLSLLAWLLVPAGGFTLLIPQFAGRVIEAILERHPPDASVPPLWQKLDPTLGSALVFFLPCFVLATVSPCMIRLTAQHLGHVGRISGLIYAAGTVGSIAGVFVSGYVLIDQMKLSNIFRLTGVLTMLLGLLCWGLDRWWARRAAPAGSAVP
jgi:hypothetical protein